MVGAWPRERLSSIPDGVLHHRWLLADEDEVLREDREALFVYGGFNERSVPPINLEQVISPAFHL
jgi:hypothetical protein